MPRYKISVQETIAYDVEIDTDDLDPEGDERVAGLDVGDPDAVLAWFRDSEQITDWDPDHDDEHDMLVDRELTDIVSVVCQGRPQRTAPNAVTALAVTG